MDIAGTMRPSSCRCGFRRGAQGDMSSPRVRHCAQPRSSTRLLLRAGRRRAVRGDRLDQAAHDGDPSPTNSTTRKKEARWLNDGYRLPASHTGEDQYSPPKKTVKYQKISCMTNDAANTSRPLSITGSSPIPSHGAGAAGIRIRLAAPRHRAYGEQHRHYHERRGHDDESRQQPVIRRRGAHVDEIGHKTPSRGADGDHGPRHAVRQRANQVAALRAHHLPAERDDRRRDQQYREARRPTHQLIHHQTSIIRKTPALVRGVKQLAGQRRPRAQNRQHARNRADQAVGNAGTERPPNLE